MDSLDLLSGLQYTGRKYLLALQATLDCIWCTQELEVTTVVVFLKVMNSQIQFVPLALTYLSHSAVVVHLGSDRFSKSTTVAICATNEINTAHASSSFQR